MLNLLLKDQQEKTDSIFSDKEILAEFNSLLIGGLDTTSHLLGMVLYHLFQNPGLLERAKEEVKQFYIKNDDEVVDMDMISKLKFISNVIKETLRMSNPAPHIVSRTMKSDGYIGGIKILKNTSVTVSIITIHYNPDTFKNPEKFDPMRWIDNETKKLNDSFVKLKYLN